MTQPCSERGQFDVPYPGGARPSRSRSAGARSRPRTSRCAISSSSAWATASRRAKAIRTCRCVSRASARRLRQAQGEGDDLTRLSGARRPLEADRRQGLHRGERALDRSGVPPLALFASVARGPAARHRGPAPRRDLRRRRLLGRGGHLRPVPALQGQRVGAQPARPVADLAIADAQCGKHEAPMQDLPEAYHMNGTIPELQGRARAAQVRSDQRAQDRSHVRLDRRQRRRLLAPSRQRRARRTNRCCASSAAGSARCTASTRRARSSTRSILRYKSLNRAIHYILHIPWEESDRVILTAYPGARAARRRQRGLPRRARRHGGAARFQAERGEGARRHLDRRQAQSRHGGRRASSTTGRSSTAHRREFIGRGICAGSTYDGGDIADDLRLPRKTDGRLAALQPGRLPGLCLAPALVPHAERRVHDRQLPRRGVAAAEGPEAQRAVVVPARAGLDLFGRLPPDRRGAGGDRRRRRRQGARRARQIRQRRMRSRARRRGAGDHAGRTPRSSSELLRVTRRRPRRARRTPSQRSRSASARSDTARASRASCPCP